MSHHIEEVRRLNDLARIQPETVNCSWVMTQGVAAVIAGDDSTAETVSSAMRRTVQLRAAIASFSEFTEDNDPHGEHDFGSFELFGAMLFWKIDYYHPDHDSHAPMPSNIELCRRVLTVMLAQEY